MERYVDDGVEREYRINRQVGTFKRHYGDSLSLAEENKIKYQDEILLRGGTDAGSMQTARGGCMAGGISIPTAYIHSVNEMIDISDVKEAIKLTKIIAERM